MNLKLNESQNTEFKKLYKDEYIKWISAFQGKFASQPLFATFGNSDGGKLYIGVADDGNVIGINNAKKLLEDIPNKVRDILGIIVDVNLHTDEDKEYLEVITDKYPYPISYKGSYYYRSGSTTQELKGVALDMWNAGDLPPYWTMDTLLQKHTSEPHNPLLAYPFFLAGYIESWGRGIEKIIEESQKFNDITPQFRWQNGLWVEFYFNKVGDKDLVKDLDRDLVKNLNPNQIKILELMGDNPNITQVELSKIVGINEKNIRNNIKKLRDLELLKRVGPAKGGYWEILIDKERR